LVTYDIKKTASYGFSTQFKLRCYLIGHQERNKERYNALKSKEGRAVIRHFRNQLVHIMLVHF